VGPTVWTARRKALGNVIPLLFWLPLTLAGIAVAVVREEVLGTGLWLIVAATVVGWLALNQFGFYQNGRMRRELERLMRAKGEDLSADRTFVGFASPRYHGLLDAHEDIGFLRILPDRLRFVSENRVLEVPKEDIREVRYRPNVHTIVGLGRWISVEGTAEGRPIRLLVEPRERGTMLGNLRYGPKLRAKLRRWLKE